MACRSYRQCRCGGPNALDPSQQSQKNSHGFVCTCSLLDKLGYGRGTDYTAVPYDWRLSPHDWMQPGEYFSQLKSAIETLRAAHGGKKVIGVAFSLGGPVFSIFLSTYVDAAWRDENIASLVSLSGTFGGVQEALAQQISGASLFGLPTMSSGTALQLFRSWASMTWMAGERGTPHSRYYLPDISEVTDSR
jgi:pimeloyl-ACP methyl ester carboxylesterase